MDRAGQAFTPTEVSVSDYLDYWFDNYCKMNLKYNTQIGYLRIYGVDARKVIIQKGKKEEKSAWYLSTPKTSASERTIKFGDTLQY